MAITTSKITLDTVEKTSTLSFFDGEELEVSFSVNTATGIVTISSNALSICDLEEMAVRAIVIRAWRKSVLMTIGWPGGGYHISDFDAQTSVLKTSANLKFNAFTVLNYIYRRDTCDVKINPQGIRTLTTDEFTMWMDVLDDWILASRQPISA